jgi:hypothetical protein
MGCLVRPGRASNRIVGGGAIHSMACNVPAHGRRLTLNVSSYQDQIYIKYRCELDWEFKNCDLRSFLIIFALSMF